MTVSIGFAVIAVVMAILSVGARIGRAKYAPQWELLAVVALLCMSTSMLVLR